ncbi:unnamed protein product [Bursaphelenchus xylophilus]|uniref:(pine wood nematode) hypothetical protein n=1 Tax=Bursaphelenchus xylophilus TaxID=6326 RepID=A0A1I7RLB6_BURXY|nr:unnamed protein product [Bursaphelenchus xylophilus]CAG9083195.1 unnamed protein product [Bursaphelenchus xylophilus]
MSVQERLQCLSQNVRDRVRNLFRHDDEGMNDQLVASTHSEAERSNQGGGYTELMGGSVPCPSCNGSGMIPKELEGTLVALIPLTDDRLKPKKTLRTIIIWITVFLLLGSSTIFVLMPRTVTISSLQKPISIVHVTKTDPQDHQLMEFDFLNRINVSSGNYLPVSIVNVSATVVSKFQPWSVDVIGHGFNNSISDNEQLRIYGRSAQEVFFNNSVSLQGYVA